MPHSCPDLLAEAVYGLPEMHRAEVAAARIVGNPGCYPTAVQLGFLPLVEAGIVDPLSLIADAKSGVSGAGRKAELGLLFSEASDNFKAYNVGAHRHHPEIVQGLGAVAKRPLSVVFTPHLVPMIRGIHATLYATLTDPGVDLQALYEKRYANEPFVDVMPAGSHPETRSVRASNVCRIAVHRPQGGDIAIVLSVIDNLVKGAAGQAIQNMNLMFGLPETTGLAGTAGSSLSARCRPVSVAGIRLNLRLGRKLRQTFGISAPRMAVRTHLSWRWKIPALCVLLALIAGMWWWGFDSGQFLGGFNRSEVAAKQERLETEVARLREENVRLRGRNSELESDLAMTRGAQATLSKQTLELQNENTQIKEELAFLQQLFSDAASRAPFPSSV